jgi:hypothetical protein
MRQLGAAVHGDKKTKKMTIVYSRERKETGAR